MKNDNGGFKVLDEWERETERQKGKTIIEFCKGKCWNASPCWMQLAVGPFWMRKIMMKKGKQTDVGRREAEYQRFASSVLWYHSVSNPCLPTLHIFSQDSTGFSHGVWLLSMPPAFMLHINIRCSAHRARVSLCCKDVWWNKDIDRVRKGKKEESKYRRQSCLVLSA